MFWERFHKLCDSFGIKPNPLGKKIGVSSGVITKWKNGSIPNGETLLKIADYFQCSVDYLLGRTDIPENPYLNLSNENNVSERMNPETEYAVKLNTSLSDIENRVNRKLQDIKNSDGLDKNNVE